MPKSGNIVVARQPRRKREPLPKKPPACGPIVRQVRGVRLKLQPAEPGRDNDVADAADRLFAEIRTARGAE